MSKIEIRDISIIFGSEKTKARKMLDEHKSKQDILKATGCTVAVKNANLSINEGEIFVIMGLSGSGKSTLLRCINRLIKPTSGEVFIDNINIIRIPDKELLGIRRKKMSMVFQHFGLLPHRSVLSNVAFGLELQGIDKTERLNKAKQSIDIVGLKGYEEQKVSELSGGMQQRVGLARALANNPEILLMDEAFSALDPLIREQMQDELLELQCKMQKTIVFITHDLDEAIKLGDRIAIMNKYVARFTENVDRGRVITAASIMIKRPVTVRLQREGPEAILRKMREKNLFALPVIGKNDEFIGEIRLRDVIKLREKGEKNIDSIIFTEIPSVLENTTVEDMLPLLNKVRQAIPVVNEKGQLAGMVSPSSVIIEMTGKDKIEINEIIQNAIDL